ncbi:MAG: AraC family transcriptional regulator [Clostridiales bacterium]|nr:AraC family transcriptional regulator [Clostridiales bacterium]
MNIKLNEQIQRNPQFTLRTMTDGNGEHILKSIVPNIPQNDSINVQAIGFENCRAEKDARTHTFESNTLHFIISGQGYFDGIPLKSGDGFAVRQGCVAEYAPQKDDPWTYCWINFDGNVSDELLNNAGFTESKCTFTCSNSEKIVKIIKDALDTDYENANIRLHLSSALLDSFAYLTSGKVETFSDRNDSVMENRVLRGIDFINRHYREKDCIALLAKEENVSMRYLSRLFDRYSDLPPQAHLIRVRIETAKHLLRTTDETVTSVAKSVGYCDVMQFSKIFRKHTGVSPSEYRKGSEDINREYE